MTDANHAGNVEADIENLEKVAKAGGGEARMQLALIKSNLAVYDVVCKLNDNLEVLPAKIQKGLGTFGDK